MRKSSRPTPLSAATSTDKGAVELDVLNYWRQQGIAGHKIDAYAAFDSTNGETTRQAISLFGGICTGLALPLSAQQQGVWDVPSLWSRLRGWDFFAQYCDEAYAPLSHDWLRQAGN